MRLRWTGHVISLSGYGTGEGNGGERRGSGVGKGKGRLEKYLRAPVPDHFAAEQEWIRGRVLKALESVPASRYRQPLPAHPPPSTTLSATCWRNIPNHPLHQHLRPRVRQQKIPLPAPQMHLHPLQYPRQHRVNRRRYLFGEERRLHGGVAGRDVFIRRVDGGFDGGEVEVGGYGKGVGGAGAGVQDVVVGEAVGGGGKVRDGWGFGVGKGGKEGEERGGSPGVDSAEVVVYGVPERARAETSAEDGLVRLGGGCWGRERKALWADVLTLY